MPIEIVTPPPGHDFRYVLFDFDGTLSLVREGWPDVMIPMFLEILQPLDHNMDRDHLRQMVSDDIMEICGRQTIYQMIRLAERVTQFGGTPDEPLTYKHEYHRRLMERIEGRRDALRTGRKSPDELLLRGSRSLLEGLAARGLTLLLASGTDEPFVREEAELLDVARYFGPHIYGARDDYKTFSKKMVIDRLLAENQVAGGELLAFGDGFVEIENVVEVGGYAVGVASDEAHGGGEPDPWKRQRLLRAGAHCIVPDFSQTDALLDFCLGAGPC